MIEVQRGVKQPHTQEEVIGVLEKPSNLDSGAALVTLIDLFQTATRELGRGSSIEGLGAAWPPAPSCGYNALVAGPDS